MAKRRLRTLLLLVALATLILGTGGCASVLMDGSCVKARIRSEPVSPGLRKIKNRYLAFVGGNPRSPGFAFLRFPLQMWGPFRYEFTAGLFNDRAVANAGSANLCTELDELPAMAGDPLQFLVLCATRQAGGFLVFASTNIGFGSPTNLPGTRFISGDKVELAVDYTGTQFHFFARPPGSLTWMEVTTNPFAYDQTMALLPSFGLSNSTMRRAEYGIDDLSIVANGDPPGMLTPEEMISLTLMDGIEKMIEAAFGLDAFGGDFFGASALLTEAEADLQDAADQIAALDESREVRRAGSRLGRSQKGLDRTQRKVDQAIARPRTQESAIIRRITGAVKNADRALAEILPYDTDI